MRVVKVVTVVVEIPNQRLMEVRPIILTQLIWIDPFISSTENRRYSEELRAKFIEKGIGN
jgi:hypothetical protein